MQHKQIALKIIALKNADLKYREYLISKKKLSDGYNDNMAKIHQENAISLNKIINKIGYPTIAKVGVIANKAAWLIVQHAIGNPTFIKKCVALLKNETEDLQENTLKLAFLSDRIAVFENKPQLYGTQFDWDKKGELKPNFYDNLEKVNQRRKSLGLNSLEEQIVLMRKRAKKENLSKPKNFQERKKEMDAWRKKVGWI